MNDFSFRFDRKFLANYLYSLYLKKKCLNCNNTYNICSTVKCVKIGCLLTLLQKKKHKRKYENVVAK